MLWVYHIWPLLCWGRFLLCPFFGKIFIKIILCWILSKAFSANIEIIILFLSFSLLIWCITLINFHVLKNPCILGINPTWSWCMSFLMCLLKFWGFLHLCSSVILVFFFCVLVVWFWYQGDGSLIEWVWRCSFLCNFFRVLEG